MPASGADSDGGSADETVIVSNVLGPEGPLYVDGNLYYVSVFEGTFTKINADFINATFNTAASMDMRSLYNGSEPQDLTSATYTGILSPSFFVEGRFSSRHFSFDNEGAPSTDLIEGILNRTLVGHLLRQHLAQRVCMARDDVADDAELRPRSHFPSRHLWICHVARSFPFL